MFKLPSILLATLSASSMFGATIYLTNTSNNLLRIDSATPGTIASSVAITGLQSGESISGIDFRPLTGGLYGLGSNSGIYTINTTTGAATFVGSFSPALSGAAFGMDFNPTVDRIRVTSNTGQNIRLNPITGALAATDTTLAYAVADPNAGKTPGVAASAYTNSFAGAVTTTLYNIDLALGILATQAPPNNGTLNTVGSLGLGALTNNAGFDILPYAGIAFASLTSAGSGTSSLYTINLATGAASLIGGIGSGQTITGLAAVADTPEPGSMGLMLVGAALIYLKKKA
jgi:hypothetical protein